MRTIKKYLNIHLKSTHKITLRIILFLSVHGALTYNECSDQKQCFGHPPGCVNKTSCDFVTSLKFSERHLDIELVKNKIEQASYIAIAFSDDQKMGNDLVFACSPSWESKTAIKLFWNQRDYYSEILYGQQDLIQNPSTTWEGSLLTCKLSLDKVVLAKGKRFEFECGYYILLAAGPVNGAKIDQHADITSRSASTSRFKTSKLKIGFL